MSEQVFDEIGTASTVASGPPVGLGALAMIEAELTVIIGHTRRPIRELLELRPGAVVSLERAPGDPVEVLANGTLVARGEMVVVDGSLGVRITEIVTELEPRS
jgi:flagellar motor switch protein FliN